MISSISPWEDDSMVIDTLTSKVNELILEHNKLANRFLNQGAEYHSPERNFQRGLDYISQTYTGER